MTAKIAASRARILDHGVDALSRRGLGGVTLGQLARDVGMSKSGLFAHFRSKDAIEIALLDRAAALSDQSVIAPAMTAPEGLPRLLALVSAWFGWSARAGLGGGCPIAAALFELDDAEGEVRDHAALLEARWRELLAGLVRAAIDAGELRPDADPDQLVWELCALYLGHHASARFQRDTTAGARAEAALAAVFLRFGAAPALLERYLRIEGAAA